MTNLLPHNELHYYIEHAWREIQHDPHHRMRIHTRLHIYDLLVQDLGVPMYELAVTNKLSFFPKLTQGLYRYVYLGFQTVTPLIPIWEHEIKR